MLAKDNTVLLVIDVQGKLAQLMHQKTDLFANIRRMVQGARILDVPILVTEQYPKGMGPTIGDIAELLDGIQRISKVSFSCCGEPAFVDALSALNRRQALLTGIETHVCVQQTGLDLIADGYEVQVVADAVSSRTPENKSIGIAKMIAAGAVATSTETALFELLRVAGSREFKEIMGLVK